MDNNDIKKMGKIILHLHLDGSLRPETVRQWLAEDGENLSLKEVEENLMVDKDCKSLNEYLTKFLDGKGIIECCPTKDLDGVMGNPCIPMFIEPNGKIKLLPAFEKKK